MQIWEDSLSTVHAVEPSEAMKQLGIQIERQWQLQAAEPAVEESDRLADLESRPEPSNAEQDPLGDFLICKLVLWPYVPLTDCLQR